MTLIPMDNRREEKKVLQILPPREEGILFSVNIV
jgi:hypothetical protein